MSEALIHHERAIVGLSIIDPSTIDRIEIDLASYVWIDLQCGHLWDVLTSMRSRGEPISDMRNVAIAARGKVSVAEIARIYKDAGMIRQDAYHLSYLTEEMSNRRLRKIASEIQSRIGFDSPDEIREWVSKNLYTVNSKTNTRNAGDIMLEVIEESRKTKEVCTVSTGIRDLDLCVGRLRPGSLMILAARPSMGKSSFAAQIAVNVAKDNYAALFVSLEMTSQETVARLLAYETGCDMRHVMDGTLRSDERNASTDVAHEYKKIPLFIEDKRGMNIGRLTSLVRSVAASRKLSIVVIDYLGLIVGDSKRQRWEQMTEISNSLKTLAQTEKVPILALAQLTREAEGVVPQLSHLRDSGSLEQDGDVIMFLHREERDSTDTDLYVAKQRNGPIGKIELKFNKKRYEFVSRVQVPVYNEYSKDF